MLRRNNARFAWVKFSEKTRHQRVRFWVIAALFDIGFNHLLSFFFTFAQSVLQKVVSSSLLSGLLFEDVVKQIFVALDKPGAILLSVFDLFFAISLNSSEQSLKLVLLFLSKDSLFLC